MDTDMENTCNLSEAKQATQEENELDFTQDLPTSEEKAIEDILMGMDLQNIVKECIPKGFEGIPEDYLQRIEKAYTLQQNFKKQREQQGKGKNQVGGIRANLKANNQITKEQPKRKGRKPNSQHL